MQNEKVFGYVDNEVEVRKFMVSVYAWMAIGVFTSGIVAFYTSITPQLLAIVYKGFYFFIIGELILVFFLARKIMSMDPLMATFFFLLYSAVNGLTLSFVFLAYTKTSINSVFFIATGMFATMSAYGFFTKKDLSGWGNILFMGLIGIIIASIVNIFLRNSALYWIISYIGVAVFVGLTAYDTQKIKNLYITNANSDITARRLSILGALKLYLDFINLFLMLLRIFGRRR